MSKKSWWAAALSVLLASCGGGGAGGGSSSDASVTYSPASLTATAFHQQQVGVNAFVDPWAFVTASVAGDLSGTVVAVVQDTGAAFAGSPVNVIQVGGGWQASLRPDVSLVPGTYTGNLRLHLCKDLACAQEYSVSGASLPYTVTILPRLQLTVFVDGVLQGLQSSGNGSLPVTVQDTHLLRIQSNQPITLQYPGGLGLPGVTVDPSSTSTDWKATITLLPMGSTQLSLAAVPQAPLLGVAYSANVDLTVVP